MKKIIVLIAALAVACLTVASCKKVIPSVELPQPVQSFLQTEFAGIPVSYAIAELCEYEVMLADGSELEFKKNGEWKKIDMKHAAVPAGVIATLPPTIPSYLDACFPGVPVEKIEKGCSGYKVELMNDLELRFSSKGVFRRIDD